MAKRDDRIDVPVGQLARGSLTQKSIEELHQEIRDLYLSDGRPWVIGYSGGKDSTTTLQMVWYSLAKLPPEQRQKPVYVIASDTLVETPVIVDHLDATLKRINEAAQRTGMPFQANKVRPRLQDTFWVNMIGKGYSAPYRRFRWCTDRLKISPANRFIEDRVSQFGEVILVLGVRRAESATRAQVLSFHRKNGELLSRHSTLTSAWVYAPIEHFSTEEVWTYLLAAPSPWGNNNRDLVTMYRNAQAGECPLVVDTTTPSCGNSRFGCWVCTVVEHDRSMEAMVDNGQEWMEPLLDFRDWLTETRDPAKKHEFREVRRRDGRVHTWGDDNNKIIWGPYKMEVRKDILRRLLQAQAKVRAEGPDKQIKLVSDEELHEIRRRWRSEEGDWQDSIPQIYRELVGEDLDWVDDDLAGSSALDSRILSGVCDEFALPQGVVRELVDLERSMQGLNRRVSVYDQIDRILGKDWRSTQQVFDDVGWTPEAEADQEAEDAS
jgi:DNA sulfur modification protein DndC